MKPFIRGTTALLGLLTVSAGGWALFGPHSFSEFVNFPPHQHFLHDIGAFQIGIGVSMVLATIWPDAVAVALAGYLVGGGVHTAVHVVDRHLGGSTEQSWSIGILAALAGAALVTRWRERGWVLGDVGAQPATELAPFARQKTVLLTTYRRDGTPVGTPMSIATEADRAYLRSFEKAGKTRRIRNNPAVTVAPATARGARTGPAVPATMRRLAGPPAALAGRALARKYPMLHGVLVPLVHRLGRSRTGRTVHFELIPDRTPVPSTPLADQSVGG